MTTHTAQAKMTQLFDGGGLPVWAVAASAGGLLAAIPGVPVIVRSLLLATFVFIGPGAACLAWIKGLPSNAVVVLVPMAGLAILVILTGAESMIGLWQPRVTLILLALASAVAGVLAQRQTQQEATS